MEKALTLQATRANDVSFFAFLSLHLFQKHCSSSSTLIFIYKGKQREFH